MKDTRRDTLIAYTEILRQKKYIDVVGPTESIVDSYMPELPPDAGQWVSEKKAVIEQIKEYVRGLDTPDNVTYQSNSLLIQASFAKAIEIIEQFTPNP